MTDLFPPSNHLIIHLNKIQPLWRWRQQAALKCQNKPIMLHGVRLQNTIMWATHMVNTWNPLSIRDVNKKFKIKKYTDTLLDARCGLKVNTERTQYMIMYEQQNADKITIYMVIKEMTHTVCIRSCCWKEYLDPRKRKLQVHEENAQWGAS